MLRRNVALLRVALAVLSCAGCKDTSNMIAGLQPTRTPTPPMRTPIPEGNRVVNVGQGGATSFVDQQSGTSTTAITLGSTVEWRWVSGFHSTTSGSCSGACTADGVWNSGAGSGMTFSRSFNQAGTFRYFCMVHGAMMTGSVVVQ